MSWNTLIASFPEPHFLQTEQWARVKARIGWQAHYLTWTETGFQARSRPPETTPEDIQAATLVLERRIPLGGFAARLSLLYAPKGPLLRSPRDLAMRNRVLDDLQHFARRRGAIFIKIDPDIRLGTGIPGTPEAEESPLGRAFQEELRARGWRYSPDQIQFRNTVLVDLTPEEDAILGRMKQKTRYNIRLAMRKGVRVRPAAPQDWGLLYRMYAETARRDSFIIRNETYYRTVFETFSTSADPALEALIAEVEGEAVAAVVIVRFAGRAYYLYGMSRPVHRNKMPSYLLQWEAMRRAKEAGCTLYDLWGAPERFDESAPMWGVFRFKRGFGGQVVRTLGAWDFIARPWWHRIYADLIPRAQHLAKFLHTQPQEKESTP